MKICPFLNQECIQERCAMWIEPVRAYKQEFGMPKEMCGCGLIYLSQDAAINLQLFLRSNDPNYAKRQQLQMSTSVEVVTDDEDDEE